MRLSGLDRTTRLLLEDLIAFGDASALEFVTRVLRSTGSRFAALYRHLPADVLDSFDGDDDELITTRAVRLAEDGARRRRCEASALSIVMAPGTRESSS